ncbi:hypothetical protein [Microbulbifer thermotolerans]|uniref:Uncharacterized protein n=1 Tax=Microbulbifer thermotolerans TaxID=252514 RepID=A0AB35I0N7_MICTH|nr:hypothetical protein [Microbulbifer thermotolerans]MCX2780429.1 hypothetical protein [Microbulbifer thermotolerans]MCX2802263.1 hypothetical protein [Microbulbifer thermotolerans]MCX2805899.1 hypothetical protein [Microbulbifer thermotolerans]
MTEENMAISYSDASALVTGLQPGQLAFQIDSGQFAGELIRIEIVRTADEDIDGDGVPDQLNLKVSGAVIDESNNIKTTPGGAPMKVPGKVESMLLSALAEGTENLEIFKADIADQCVQRMLRLATQLYAFENIPSEA